MNARTSVLILSLLFCVGAVTLTAWKSLATDEVARSPTGPQLNPRTEQVEGSAAEDGRGLTLAEVEEPTRRVDRVADSSSLVPEPKDDDLDASASPLGEGCEMPEIAPARVPAPRAAGSIRGTFLREGGPWTAADIPAENTVILDLASIDDPKLEAVRARSIRVPGDDGTIAWTFEFADVLEGEYLLTLSALGARRWSPTALRVRAPLDGIVFTRFDKDRVEPLSFEVFDAASGAPLAPFDARHIQVTTSDDNGVFLHTGPLDLSAFPLDARFQWSLRVEGYAVAFGDETAFVRRGERRVAEVRLTPGWASRVFVLARDPVGRPVAGAEVFLDGVRAGITGQDGMLVVRSAAEPARIEAKWAGFVQREGAASSGAYTPRQRGGITVVMLDRK